VFDMLMLIILYISLNVADVSLSESGHLVPYGLTPHRPRNLQYPHFRPYGMGDVGDKRPGTVG